MRNPWAVGLTTTTVLTSLILSWSKDTTSPLADTTTSIKNIPFIP